MSDHRRSPPAGARSDEPGSRQPRDGYGGGYSHRARDSGRGYPNERKGSRGRGDDRRYYEREEGGDRVSSWRGERDDERRCQECGAFNDSRSHTYCKNCDDRKGRRGCEGRPRADSYPYERRHRSVSEGSAGGDWRSLNRADGRRSDADSGYYGPASTSESCRRRGEESFSDKKPKRQKLEKKSNTDAPCWPPPFDQDGAAYVFDARSSFFYEAASDFFYDPKTKLYYGNKQGAYFQHVPGGSPPYLMVSHHQQQDKPHMSTEGAVASAAGGPPLANPAPVTEVAQAFAPSTSSAAPPPSAQAKPSSDSASKKKIEISLKSKKPLGGGSCAAVAVAASTQPNVVAGTVLAKAKTETKRPRTADKHASDIAKWSGRQRENKNNDKSEVPSLAKTSQTTTKKGEPICFLCKRKFANMEKLRQHEQMSALHKQNLSKKKAAEAETKKASASTTAAPSVEYRDRAKDRRVLYCPDASSGGSQKPEETIQLGPSLEKARTVTATEMVKPDEILGDTNIGSKMLQKLGWQKGASLGRKLDGSCEDAGEGRSSAGNNELKKDWEKIESIASGSHVMAKGGGIGDSSRGS